VQLGIVQSLYRPEAWRVLESAIDAALDGNATMLVRLADVYLGRRGSGYDNSFEMNAAVNCLDYEFSRDLTHYQTTFADALERRAPRFGRSFAPGGIVCALWPAPSQPIALTDAADAPPVLVIGTTNDPATPFAWALGLRQDLPSSVLLTHEGDGHTIYASGKRCIDETVNRYLVTLATPEDGAICGMADSTPRTPPTPPAAAAPSPGDSSLLPSLPADPVAPRNEASDKTAEVAWRFYLARLLIGLAVIAAAAVFVFVRMRARRW
jgi:hypothetical protein